MNWTAIITDLQGNGFTLERIAQKSGMASKGHVHDLKSGAQKTIPYEVGCKLVELHRRTLRKAARQAA